MRENQLPVHYTSAEETGPVRPAVDSGDGGVHISIPISGDEISSVSNLDSKSADGTKVAWSLSVFNDEAAALNVTPRRGAEQPTQFSAAGSASAASASKLGTWLLAVISVTTVYTICNPKWVPSCVAQTVKISKQLSADITTSASTTLGGTAVTDAAKAGDGTVADGTRENSRRQTHNGNGTARSNADDSWSGGGMLPAPSPQSQPTTNLKKAFMVPPPPPTPCVLPPGFGFFPGQPAQQDEASQQQLEQAQEQASPETDNQAAARENTPQQLTAASGRSEATQSAAQVVANQKRQAADQDLQAADKELQAALHSSLGTVREWTR